MNTERTEEQKVNIMLIDQVTSNWHYFDFLFSLGSDLFLFTRYTVCTCRISRSLSSLWKRAAPASMYAARTTARRTILALSSARPPHKHITGDSHLPDSRLLHEIPTALFIQSGASSAVGEEFAKRYKDARGSIWRTPPLQHIYR